MPGTPTRAARYARALATTATAPQILLCLSGYRATFPSVTSTTLSLVVDRQTGADHSFPSEEAAIRLIYLAIPQRGAAMDPDQGWTKAMLAFKIQFGDRIPH